MDLLLLLPVAVALNMARLSADRAGRLSGEENETMEGASSA